jgi:hypothetical protein
LLSTFLCPQGLIRGLVPNLAEGGVWCGLDNELVHWIIVEDSDGEGDDDNSYASGSVTGDIADPIDDTRAQHLLGHTGTLSSSRCPHFFNDEFIYY